MKKLLLFVIYFIAFPIIASAQAKGGQITRKKPKVSKTKKDNKTSTTDFSFKPVVTKPITPPKKEIQPISIDRLSFYNIVVCSYNLLSDAQKECKKLRDDGYFSEYFFDSSYTYRVLLYKTTSSEQNAKSYLKNARRIYPNAWIMCVENGRTFRYY